MKNSLLIALCLVCTVTAEVNYDVKRGIYPYMAFLYYPDETVVENGVRFFRDAILIKPDWLISSAIDHPQGEGFPRKTLLARAGAVTIDSKVTLNEDEDEQEREVIQIVRPSLHDQNIWFVTDITLLNTLLPFNITSAVSPYNYQPINMSRDEEKICMLLVYARDYENSTDDKRLMQLTVELVVPATKESCGEQLSSEMTCAVFTDETKGSLRDPNFCQGNSGGPLICDNEIVAIQTYINYNCKPPHFYQLLYGWGNLIECALKNSCSADYCSCNALDKDPPVTEMIVSHTPDTGSDYVLGAEPSEVPQSVAEITSTATSMVTEASSESLEPTSPTESITTESVSTTVEPESTTLEPDSTTVEPESTTTETERTTTVTEIKTTESEINITEPEIITTEPLITTTKQETTSNTTTEQTTLSNTPEITESVTTTTPITSTTAKRTTKTSKAKPKITKTTTVKPKKTTKKIRTTVNSTTPRPQNQTKAPFTAEIKNELESDAEETGAAVRRINVEAQQAQPVRLKSKSSTWSHMSLLQILLSSIFIIAVIV